MTTIQLLQRKDQLVAGMLLSDRKLGTIDVNLEKKLACKANADLLRSSDVSPVKKLKLA